MIGVSLADDISKHEPDLSKAFLERVRPHDSFLDVGAHIGDYGRAVRKLSDGQIVSVEPNPLCGREILVNAIEGQSILVSAMIGDRPGLGAPLTLPVSDWMDGRGLAYGCGGASVVPMSGEGGAAQVLIPAVTIDDLLRPFPGGFDLLKIDIEGSEPEAIRGGSVVLTKVRVLALEVHMSFLLRRCGNNKASVEAIRTEMRSRLHGSGLRLVGRWDQDDYDKSYELWERP